MPDESTTGLLCATWKLPVVVSRSIGVAFESGATRDTVGRRTVSAHGIVSVRLDVSTPRAAEFHYQRSPTIDYRQELAVRLANGAPELGMLRRGYVNVR